MMATELEELNDLIDALKNCNENMGKNSDDFNISMVRLFWSPPPFSTKNDEKILGSASVYSFRTAHGKENFLAFFSTTPDVSCTAHCINFYRFWQKVAIFEFEENWPRIAWICQEKLVWRHYVLFLAEKHSKGSYIKPRLRAQALLLQPHLAPLQLLKM